MAYSHEEYMKHRTSIRKAQKKYYEKNKTSIRKVQKKYYEKNKKKIVKKYASVRRKWDKAHRKYLNEHARLSKQRQSALADNEFGIALRIRTCKVYLRDLHKRGLV